MPECAQQNTDFCSFIVSPVHISHPPDLRFPSLSGYGQAVFGV